MICFGNSDSARALSFGGGPTETTPMAESPADALRDQIDAAEYRRSAQKVAARNSRRET